MDRDLEKPNNTSILMDESHQKLLEMINTFRTNPQSFIEYKKSLKKKNHPEYEEFLNSLEPKNELQPDEELTNIAKEEVKKFSENSEYNNYQIGEEFQQTASFGVLRHRLGHLVQHRNSVRFEDAHFVNKGGVDHVVGVFLIGKDIAHLAVTHTLPAL